MEKWPLFTFELVEGKSTKCLLVSLNLLVCDGDSMKILLNELADLLEGKTLSDYSKGSYASYFSNLEQMKNKSEYDIDREYWLKRVDGFGSYPQIPTLQNLKECKEYTIVRKSEVIDGDTWKKFKAVSKEHRISPSALLCAIYGKVLSIWSNQNEFMLNLTVFQREEVYQGVNNLIGDFTKLLPLQVENREEFWGFAEGIQNQIMKDLDHLSFDGTETLREMSKRRAGFGKAFLPVVFTCVLLDDSNNYFRRLGELRYAVSQTPQVFLDNQITELDGELHVSWDIVKELFNPFIIEEIFCEFIGGIKNIAENREIQYPTIFIKKILDKQQKKCLLGKFPEYIQTVYETESENISIYVLHNNELCPPEVPGEVYLKIKSEDLSKKLVANGIEVQKSEKFGEVVKTGTRGALQTNGEIKILSENERIEEKELEKKHVNSSSLETIGISDDLKCILEIWKKIFDKEDIQLEDDFYSLGGESILLMKLVDEMNLQLNCNITIDDILQSNSIEEFAKKIKN